MVFSPGQPSKQSKTWEPGPLLWPQLATCIAPSRLPPCRLPQTSTYAALQLYNVCHTYFSPSSLPAACLDSQVGWMSEMAAHTKALASQQLVLSGTEGFFVPESGGNYYLLNPGGRESLPLTCFRPTQLYSESVSLAG